VILCHVGGIGDHYLSLPAMRALINVLGSKVRLAGHPEAIHLVYGELGLEGKIIDFTVKDGSLTRDIRSVVDEIGDCEFLVSLVPLLNGIADEVVTAVKPAASIGFGAACGTRIRLNERQHAIDMYLDVPRALDSGRLGGDIFDPPKLPARSLAFAREIRGQIPRGVKLLAVHADTKPDKMWDTRCFVDLLHGFASDHPEVFVVIVGSIDLGLTLGPVQERMIPCMDIPLLDSIALVSQADAFLGVDSCMLHLADLFRIPSVGLFGCTDSRLWGLRFARGKIVEGHGSMSHISVAEARSELEALWRIAASPTVQA
jgi:ADP-heptose:LPS heptosyltransferase